MAVSQTIFAIYFALVIQPFLQIADSNSSTQCPYNCLNYFDGCNGCTCTEETNFIPLCTLIFCEIDDYEEPECYECPNNLVFGTCDACWREKTCANPDGAEICTDNCVQECACPADFPIYDEDSNSCLTLDECNRTTSSTTITPSTTTEEPTEPEYCPEYCLLYFDGCNTCSCDEETGKIGACTRRFCDENTVEDAKCLTCKNNLEWTTCGSECWQEKTCDNPDGSICSLQCVEQCQCPDNRPIWVERRERCKKRRRCRRN